MNRNQLPYRIQFSGEAGEGVLTTGDLLVSAVSRLGYNASVYKSFPPNIRGGYSRSLVTISKSAVVSPVSQFDMIFILNPAAFNIEIHSFPKNALIITDTFSVSNSGDHRIFTVPFSKISVELTGSVLPKSICALGVAGFLLKIPVELLVSLLEERFSSKGQSTIEKNCAALQQGYTWAKQNLPATRAPLLKQLLMPDQARVILEGNQAIALGALVAGCTFFASYPITPATSTGDFLSLHLPSTDGFAYQAEDEISALGAVIGAVFSGAKGMTATSGPGLSLMQELISYASMIELPVVIANVMRAGPSTGMPTKYAQDYLMASVFGGHGDDQRIILAPTSVSECFTLTVEAFNISERYQCPVILLSDSALAKIKDTFPEPSIDDLKITERCVANSECVSEESEFLRYFDSESGLNPIPVPGISNCSYRVTGVEHNEDGTPGFSSQIRVMQMKKRARKLDTLSLHYEHLIETDIVADSDFTLISWGFSAAATRAALQALRSKGAKVSALYPKLIYPFLTEVYEKTVDFNKPVIIIESNFTGQFCRLFRMHFAMVPLSISASTGEPFTPEFLLDEIRKRIR